MSHAIVPVFDETAVHNLVFLSADAVRQSTRIAHRNFLIPFLFSHLHLTFERIELREADTEVGQSE